MAALLIALSVMSVMMAVAMPAWKQMAQREKEEELIFRGKQYARAIGLFQRRAGPGALPPNLDVLVEQHFLRKKYKDPITGGDFQPLLAGQATPGTVANPAQGAGGAAGRGQAGAGAPSAGAPGQAPTTGRGATGGVGGIQGVVSKSTAKSIRIYNGRSVYNEWAFVFVPQVQAPAGGAAGPGAPGGGVGGRGQNPGGAGGPQRGNGRFGGGFPPGPSGGRNPGGGVSGPSFPPANPPPRGGGFGGPPSGGPRGN